MRNLRRRSRNEGGAVLVLMALLMTALVVIVALVIDIGFVRNTRQNSKSTSDAAAAAGLQSLAPDAVPRPWRGVCSALQYLRDNEADRSFTVEYFDGDLDPVSGDPCATPALLSQVCLANTPDSWAWIRATDGDYLVDIRSGYITPDPSFPEDTSTYSGDNGASARGGCDQLAVIVSNTDDVYFGGVAGASGGYDTAIRTVGRVEISSTNEGVPAFLMLERNRCGVLTHSVGDGGGSGIIVEAAGSEPGVVHVDSSGTSSCGGSTENAYTVYGTTIDSNPGIRVLGTPTGFLTLRAIAVGNAARGYSTPTGVSPAGTAGGLVSRAPVDEKYNPPSSPTITNLYASARSDAILTSPPDATYHEVTTCNNHDTASDDAARAAMKIFVNCPGGYKPQAANFENATDIIFNGWVQVANNSELYLPNAQRIVVGGDSTRGLEVSNGALFGVNSAVPAADTNDGVRDACAGREGPGGNSASMVIFGGSSSGAGQGGLNVAGRAALCQTAVLLAGPSSVSSYTAQQTVDGTYDSTCVAETPCTKDTGNTAVNAQLIISGFVRWSAPNASNTQPAAGSVGLEDLALWTETAQLSEVKSGGIWEAQGVHFLPNAAVEMRSPATANPQDAQFIARSLKLFAGTLRMRPTEGNNVEVNVLAGVQLVR